MKQKIELLKELLVIIEEMNGTHDFIGKDDVQQRLRWTAKSLAEQIHDKRLDLTVSAYSETIDVVGGRNRAT